MGCLDEHSIVAFVTGGLDRARLAEVEHHLLACPSCAALVAVAAPPVAPSQSHRAPTIAAGIRVGRYRLVRLVGRGGVGEVWAAHDSELDRKVAIKIVRSDTYANEIDSARLLREAHAIARLSHPNVVPLYDVGIDKGRVFLAMELIEGETLAAWLERRRPSHEDVLKTFVQAGSGLGAAHRAGIIHRDFKPQNVMVALDGRVRVMDFGLAASKAGAHPGQPRLTRAGAILGTPRYMSPEQLRAEPVDPRADQYSFCVALYEALYGERPYGGRTFRALRAAVLAGRPRAAPGASRVPARLRAVLLRGLASKRERRFPEMDALLAALLEAARPRDRSASRTALVASAAVLAVGAVVAGQQLRAHRRSPPCADVGARLASAWPMKSEGEGARRRDMRAAFLASGVPDALERYQRTAQRLDAYGATWVTAVTQSCAEATRSNRPQVTSPWQASCLDDRLAQLDALTDVLARSDDKVVRKAIEAALSLPPVETCSGPAAPEVHARPDDPALRIRVEGLRGRLVQLRAMAAAGHDLQALQPIGALADEVRASGYEPLLAETLLVFGRVRSPLDPDGAVAVYEEAFTHSVAIRNDALAAEAAIQLIAIVGALQHRFDAAARWTRLAEETLDRATHGDRLRGRMLNSRGALHAAQGQWRLASADFAAAVASVETSLGAGHPELATSLVNLARADLALEAPDQALAAASRALAIAGAVYPADAYEVGAARLVRGQALLASARPQEARRELEVTRDTFQRIVGRDHPLLADPLTALGQVALLEGRPSNAQALLERAWEIRSTHTADAGAREETAFSLACAIWEVAPGDRGHAMELAEEARNGYGALPDLAPRFTAVERWIDARR